MRKYQFINHLLAERDHFEHLLNEVGAARLTTLSGVSGLWSVKDIIAHVMSYEQYVADRITEIIQGETYRPARTQPALEAFLDKFGYPDFGSRLLDDEIANTWVVAKYHNTPLDDVVAHELQAFGAILSGLSALSEAQVAQNELFSHIAEHTYEHYHEHVKDIQRWLALIN